MSTHFITNQELYEQVIKPISDAKRFVWIGTADIKDLHVKHGASVVSFLHILDMLARRKVAIRLIHAKEPGINFQKSLKKYAFLKKSMEMMLCPRVHFKHIVIDGTFAYTGSANLTGAGLGIKSSNHRNFEAGFVSTDENLINQIMDQFDDVWMETHCKDCKRKEYCKNPLK
jgi:phosphatidylserine/phosphatidylglycerophosphate/cardiolipin synthase-like enzyme